ncbi:DUF2339 domain-containing protein [Butyrivibrio proteoclasticus]|uniref:DUF2339 domain-containing protein n=1 Tax=Butyrivibrio proteoclasticus TaxID=43305 RepID=UPI000478E85C|nr:DUF2157 domain-containing protein [Butyrivibrio proteoclasticus]
MGQIEELENELSSIQAQVNNIQASLNKTRSMVSLIKQSQSSHVAQLQTQSRYMQQTRQPQQAQPQSQFNPQYQQVNPQPQIQQTPYQQVPATPQYRQVQPQYQQANQPYNQTQPRPAQATQYQQPVYRTVQPQQANNRQVVVQPGAYNHAGSKPNTSESAESWIGKHLMSIMASVLIFVALILFASLIIPYLSDGIKITLMFTVSLGLSAFAYFMHRKKPDNTFYTALLACGIGCSYISILVTRISFDAIGDIGMYVLMLVWGIAVLFLARKENWLFQIISNAGFVISSIMAFGIDSEKLILPLLAYLIIMGGAHQFIFWKNSLQRKLQFGVNLAILAQYTAVLRVHFDGGAAYIIAFVIMSILALAAFLYFTFGDFIWEKASSPYFALAGAATLAITYYGLMNGLGAPDMARVCGLLVIGVLAEVAMIMTDRKNPDNEDALFSLIWISIWFSVVAIIAFNYVETYYNTGIVYLLLAPLALWGIKSGNKCYKWQAFALAAVFALIEMWGGMTLIFSIMAFAYTVLVFVIEAFILNNTKELKLSYYIFTMVNLLIMMNAICGKYEIADDYRLVLMTVPAGLLNAAMMIVHFDRDNSGESDLSILKLLNAFNIIGMITGLYDMLSSDNAIAIGISLVFTVTLASINLKHHMEGKGEEKLYAGIKYGIILISALFCYDAKGYIASVVILAYAIVCIIIGFSKRFGAKELRVYGLILSMICVVKFIMIDTTYENTLGHALSFLISGILCFAISAIYNHFAKQDLTEDNNTADRSSSSQL